MSSGPSRAPQGQRCPGCGQFEADPWARFCGVCGSTLGPGGAPGGQAAGATGRMPAAAPAPPVGYGPAGAAPAPVPSYAASAPGAGQPVVYTIPSVGFAGPARIGAAVSAAFMLVPCVLFAFIGAWLVHAGRVLLDSWLGASVRVPVPVVSVDLNMNFVELLRLRPLYDLLIWWDDRLWLTFAIFWLVPWALWILAGVLFAILLAAIYNTVGKLGGGIRLTLRPADVQPVGPPGGAPAAWPNQGWPPAQHR